jgi:hypothetical protein
MKKVFLVVIYFVITLNLNSQEVINLTKNSKIAIETYNLSNELIDKFLNEIVIEDNMIKGYKNYTLESSLEPSIFKKVISTIFQADVKFDISDLNDKEYYNIANNTGIDDIPLPIKGICFQKPDWCPKGGVVPCVECGGSCKKEYMPINNQTKVVYVVK